MTSTSAIARPTRRLAAARGVVRSVGPFAAAVVGIILGLGIVVDALHDQAEVQRRAQAAVSEMEADAAELQRAEEALLMGGNDAAARADVVDELADLEALLVELRSARDEEVVTAVAADVDALEAALVVQLGHLADGNRRAADTVHEQQTDAAFAEFDREVEAAHQRFEAAAERSAEVSNIGLWLAVGCAAVTIGVLAWRHERGRKASRQALEERLRERAVELAELSERHRQLEGLKYSFVTAVSHELRTPLTAIRGSLEVLEDGDAGPLPERADRIVSVAVRGTRRLSRLVEDIIDLERLASGHFGFQPVATQLDRLLEDASESLAPVAEGAGVDMVVHAAPVTVTCDPDRILQALVNLIGNAIKFTPRGGAVHLGARRVSDEVEVIVRDEGRGIPAEHLDAVFDRFHQVDTATDKALGGTGLGLTITRQIVEAHGGRIWVESDYGSGTTFRFTLPLTAADAPSPVR